MRSTKNTEFDQDERASRAEKAHKDRKSVESKGAAKRMPAEASEEEEEEEENNNGMTKKLCGYPVARHYHPYITFFRTTIEIAILGIVFGLSWQYFASITTVSLVPQSECHKCDSCQAQYELSADHSSVVLPLRYFVKNASAVDYMATQDITFYANWQSCGAMTTGSLSLPTQKAIHQTGNVNFPFAKGNKSTTYDMDGDVPAGYESFRPLVEETESFEVEAADDLTGEDGYYYSYGVLDPKNVSKHKNNAMSITLSVDALSYTGTSIMKSGIYSNVTYSNTANISYVEPDTEGNCFTLVCGAIDYFTDKTSKFSSSAVEVLSTSANPYIQMQAVLASSSTSITGTCTATVYGSPMPFFFTSSAVTQSTSFLCSAKSTNAQVSSLSFANLLIAFGVMNFAAKASNRISKVGFSKFITSCGAEVLDI
jgi:hypothetical protein